MPRYRLTLEYDGRGLVGWQRQDNGPSVQQALEEAAFAFAGERVGLTAAGRTDAGVHALGQVAHVDLSKDWPAGTVRDALNHHVKPTRVAVVACKAVDDEFHARFSAVKRAYLYRIVNRRAPLTFEAGLAWRVPAPLDAPAMNAAGQRLLGRHDFTTFRDAACQAESPVRTLDRLDAKREGDAIEVRVEARSFLHRQVRSIVGTLAKVGDGSWTPDDVADALDARDRARCGPVAPADGLYLTRVDYACSAPEPGD